MRIAALQQVPVLTERRRQRIGVAGWLNPNSLRVARDGWKQVGSRILSIFSGRRKKTFRELWPRCAFFAFFSAHCVWVLRLKLWLGETFTQRNYRIDLILLHSDHRFGYCNSERYKAAARLRGIIREINDENTKVFLSETTSSWRLQNTLTDSFIHQRLKNLTENEIVIIN